VGYLLPGRYAAKAFEIKATTNVCCATPTQTAVAEYLAQGTFERHLRKTRAVLERQARMMERRVLECFPQGSRVTHPGGGTVLWIQMPPGVDSIRLFYEAKAKGIGVAPGNIFSSCDQFAGFLRISYGNAWSPVIENAVAELGRLARSQCDA
jgi:DNA-binding transcriptional MocR family regulator